MSRATAQQSSEGRCACLGVIVGLLPCGDGDCLDLVKVCDVEWCRLVILVAQCSSGPAAQRPSNPTAVLSIVSRSRVASAEAR